MKQTHLHRGAAMLAACAVAAAISGCTTPNLDSSTVVEIDGNRETAAEFVNAGCSRSGDSITIGSGSVQTARGVGGQITDGNPPKVNALFIATGGNVYSIVDTPVGQIGSTTVARAGNRYTLTGEVRSITLDRKKFRVEFTCS